MKKPEPAPRRSGEASPATVPSGVSRIHGTGSPPGETVSIETTAGETCLTIGANGDFGMAAGAEVTPSAPVSALLSVAMHAAEASESPPSPAIERYRDIPASHH